jgi:hypothetical protein
MLTREQIDLAVLVVAPIAAGWIFVRVAREEIAIENTATDEMRARSLDFYKCHLNDEGRSALTRRDGQKSRIADTAATTNNTRRVWE